MKAPSLCRIAQLLAFLLVAATPLFIVTASVAWAVNDGGLYRRGFREYQVSAITRITEEELDRVGAEIRRYFNSGAEPLYVTAKVGGIERELFNRREVLHMVDVKRLVRGVYIVAAVTGTFLLLTTVAGVTLLRRRLAPVLAFAWALGGGATLALLLLVGLLALVGFDRLFLLFHQISFRNDLWQLDPRSDFLLMLFPQEFWFYATMRVAATSALGGLLALGIAGGWLLWRQRFSPSHHSQSLSSSGKDSPL